jgi:hypothetical protein
MNLFDDGYGSLLALLRPKSTISRLEERAEPRAIERHWIDGLGAGVILRVPEPAASSAALASLAARAQALAGSSTALLTPHGGGSADAALVWFAAAAAAPPRLCMAALVPALARRRGSRVSIETDVECDICGKPQYAAGAELEQLGAEGLSDLDIIPICASCLGTAAQDPELWERRRTRQAGARLRLVCGEGEALATARDRDHLRLVREESR